MSELQEPNYVPNEQVGHTHKDAQSQSGLQGITPASQEIFASPPPQQRGLPPVAWGVAGLVVLILIAVLVFATRKPSSLPANVILPPDPYAANLPISQLAMSESTSLSGGKSTFIDGHIRNTGSQTVTAITVQVIFRNDEAMPPQIVNVPMALIRTREPYVDTQPISTSPLKPGEDREFRLIFENISNNWNTQMPEIHPVQVTAH
jgi:Protein of unknown function (DUF2393)